MPGRTWRTSCTLPEPGALHTCRPATLLHAGCMLAHGANKRLYLPPPLFCTRATDLCVCKLHACRLCSHPLDGLDGSFTSAAAGSLPSSPLAGACGSPAWQNKQQKLPPAEDSSTGLLTTVPDAAEGHLLPALAVAASQADQASGLAAIAQEQLQRAAVSISPRGPLLEVRHLVHFMCSVCRGTDVTLYICHVRCLGAELTSAAGYVGAGSPG